MSARHILVTGVTGMLGHALLRDLAGRPGLTVTGTLRGERFPNGFPVAPGTHLKTRVDITDEARLRAIFDEESPDVVINAAGLIKQRPDGQDPELAMRVNGQAPHMLARLCAEHGSRLIHISTDCVFRGDRGNYRESDVPDADDVYGRSKLMGEVTTGDALTLRTSIIGPELSRHLGLLDWFLSQHGAVPGYRHAVFSGLTTTELARVLREYVLPRRTLRGLYHVSANPISKHELLMLIHRVYRNGAAPVADDGVVINRSLDSRRFQDATGYRAPGWPALIQAMKDFGRGAVPQAMRLGDERILEGCTPHD